MNRNVGRERRQQAFEMLRRVRGVGNGMRRMGAMGALVCTLLTSRRCCSRQRSHVATPEPERSKPQMQCQRAISPKLSFRAQLSGIRDLALGIRRQEIGGGIFGGGGVGKSPITGE